MKRLIVITMLASSLIGCAASVGKMNTLQPGMSIEDVKQTMGEPSTTQFADGKMVLRYDLRQGIKGIIPQYIVIDVKTKTVIAWYADKDAEQRNEAAWQALAVQQMLQQQQINLNIRHY
jgi:hypothetical protein